MSGAADRERARATLSQLEGITVPPEVDHDADYWRGALKVIAERERRIRKELSDTERQRQELERVGRLASRAKRDAILATRSLLTRAEVARLLDMKAGSVAKLLSSELRNRGMGAKL